MHGDKLNIDLEPKSQSLTPLFVQIVVTSIRGVWMTHLWESYSNGRDEEGDNFAHAGDPAFKQRVLDFLRGETVINPLPNGWRDYVAPSGPFIDPTLFNQRGDQTKVFIYTPLKYGHGETLAEFKELRNLKYEAQYRDKGEAMKATKDR